MDDNSDSHSPAVNQANVDGRIYWDQVNGSIDITAGDNATDTLIIGKLPSGTLGMQVVNSTGIVLFDAFQTTSVIVSDTNTSGDFTDIQNAIDSLVLGGEVFIRNGTYLLNSDIIVPSNITITGETASGVVLDFQSQAYQVNITGSDVYDTGTVAATNNSTDVIGTGTAWDSLMEDQSISLNGIWYRIINVISPTELTIEVVFEGDTFSGAYYAIATLVSGVTLRNLTIQNSLHADGAVFMRYGQAIITDTLNVYTSNYGLNYRDCSISQGLGFYTSGCGFGVNIQNCSTFTLYNFECYASGNSNLLVDSFYNASVSNFTLSTPLGNNLTISNSSNWGLYDFSIINSAAIGIEMTGCSNISIFGGSVSFSASDGIKFTSDCDYNSVSSTFVRDNGGYGINIADASDDKNTITGSMIANNSSGSVQDNGTNTINANNQT